MPETTTLTGRAGTGSPRSTPTATAERRSGPFTTRSHRRRYVATMAVLGTLALAITVGLLTYGNPMDVGTDGYWRIVDLRVSSVLVILVVAFCHAFATVSFQTATGNRIITPSIMGFEALYVLIQTGAVFVFGASGVLLVTGTHQFLLQAALMVALATALYGWLLSGRFGDIHIMLLVGVILGGGLGALSTFMQRLLTPSEFDILTARLFGNVSNADAEYLPWAIPIALVAGGVLLARARRLDVLALGREPTTNLGLNHRREVMLVLLLVSVLMAMTTALVGPMTFLGFLVAMLAYQLADTYDHRLLLPMAFLLGYVVLGGAYFVLRHVFYAQGMVTIIVELVGGLVFLVHIVRKGRL
ncbi:iron chelate uptake ABC transporter family permease subunit [Serinicoccus sp. LYQ131]|uniref:iron chelate uptake ABC transporter family permease subunit n=1 Tax=Serinicoccus sp. LYQ131 TaxID=3378797 RepID=UPI003851F99C